MGVEGYVVYIRESVNFYMDRKHQLSCSFYSWPPLILQPVLRVMVHDASL